IIAYAPTFRDHPTQPPFSDSFYKELQHYLQKTNGILVIKKHPVDKFLKLNKEYPNIKDLSANISDIQDLLVVADLLISDYSSVSTDFSLTGRPILIYAYDLQAYIENCRTLYYDLEAVLPQPFVKEERELLDKIRNLEWVEQLEIKESYTRFRNSFHKYTDGKSSQRVVQEIKKLSKE